MTDASVTIERFHPDDADAVQALFTRINRELAPPDMRDAFEAYIARSIEEEVGRIEAYYRERDGGFWVARSHGAIAGMFGLEKSAPDAMELRRMYVDPRSRRGGVARSMLAFAEAECRRRGAARLELSTSELQPAALALYRNGAYRLVREAVADAASNKIVGAGVRRYYFEKLL